MKLTPTLGGAYSGSFGGLTASHNRGGQYLRRRAVPTNPNSEGQASARASFGMAASRWTEVLTEGQRSDWNNYASAIPWVDKLGQTITLSGQQMYIRAISTPIYAQSYGYTTIPLSTIDNAPTDPTLGPMVTISNITIEVIDGTPDTWPLTLASLGSVDDDDAYYLYLSGPVSAGTNFCKGPYLLTNAFLWDSHTATADLAADSGSPWNSRYAPPTVGQRYFGFIRTLTQDGKMSKPTYFGPTVVAVGL